MHLKSLKLLNFKNHEELEASFSPKINCFVGHNGAGKTNLLDAIYYTCLTKSALARTEAQSIAHEADFYTLLSTLEKNGKTHTVLCSYQRGKKKTFKLDKKEYQKVSEHIGKFPAVIMLPTDTDLIQEGSEGRRKFFDSMISQLDRNYLNRLISYNQALKQRNALLKQFAEQNRFSPDLLEPYDVLLAELALAISEKRRTFIQEFSSVFLPDYQSLTKQKEEASLSYKSSVSEDYLTQLRQLHSKDLYAQRTTQGAHKDDYEFLLDGHSLKRFGSQGQQKSYAVALKLAQFDFIFERTGTKPLLLMDDIFDKLDDDRISTLIQMLEADRFGQVFITDARPERSKALLSSLSSDPKILHLQ